MDSAATKDTRSGINVTLDDIRTYTNKLFDVNGVFFNNAVPKFLLFCYQVFFVDFYRWYMEKMNIDHVPVEHVILMYCKYTETLAPSLLNTRINVKTLSKHIFNASRKDRQLIKKAYKHLCFNHYDASIDYMDDCKDKSQNHYDIASYMINNALA